MAKTSQRNRDELRKRLIKRYAARRAELRKKIKDPTLDPDEKSLLQARLDKLPRNSCPTRWNNRCAVSGRSRAYYRKFGISRIALRDLALKGQIPGIVKASW
jgi:small subunit ribosomal protein S14